MKRLAIAGVGSVAVALALGWSWLGHSGLASEPVHSPQTLPERSSGSLHGAGSVPLPRPRSQPAVVPSPAALPSRARLAASAPSGPASVAAQFRLTHNLKVFADELLAREARLTREERYYLAKALETCGFAVSINDDLVATSQQRRREFLQTLSHTDPEYDRRVAAYDSADDTARCRGFQGHRIAQKKIDELYRDAGDAGDPRAQARLLVADLSKALAIPKNSLESSRYVELDNVQRIISLLESRDGEAIVTVAQMLAEHRLIEQMRIGPNGETPNPASLVGAFTLVACDFQPTCSAFDREALQACAHAGYCSAGSFEELYANFLASPFAWSLASQYRTLIHTAIETRDWSLLGLQKLVGARAKARS